MPHFSEQEDTGVLRTDEQQDPSTRYEEAEKVFDSDESLTQVPDDQQSSPKTVFHQVKQMQEGEDEPREKAVRDAYQDS